MSTKAYAIRKLKGYYTGDPKELEIYEQIGDVLHDKNSCELCTLNKLEKEILLSDNVKILRAAIKVFSELWQNAEFNSDYYECIVNGSWPNADEIIANHRK